MSPPTPTPQGAASLLALPPELRFQIYTSLPGTRLLPFYKLCISTQKATLTPAISRSHPLLRKETLPLFARNNNFDVDLDDDGCKAQIAGWVAALSNDVYGEDEEEEEALSEVRSLQFSQHWKLQQPSRWQGHVGFYLKLGGSLEEDGESAVGGRGGELKVAVGTWPNVRDTRGMRSESLVVLERCVRDVMGKGKRGGGKMGLGLKGEDVFLIMKMMDVVASHPIPTHDIEQSEVARKQRRGIFEKMERELVQLADVGQGDNGASGGTFFTPY